MPVTKPTELPADAPAGTGTLLFGGSGFLGPYLLENQPGMISAGRTPPKTANRHIQVDDLSDLRALEDVSFEKVIFIIGNTDHHRLEQERLDRHEPNAFDYHVMPFVRVMEQIKHRPITKVVHCSTVLLYDSKRMTLPVSEQAPIDPYKNRYVLSKYLGEETCKYYARWLPIINVRFSNLYGPTSLRRFDLIHVLCRRLLTEGSAEIWNDVPSRDFIYVEDAAEALAQLIETDFVGTVNLGTGTMRSVREVVDILQKVSGCPIHVRKEPVDGPTEFRCDMTTLNRLIPWRPRVELEEGVRRTFEATKTYIESGELAEP